MMNINQVTSIPLNRVGSPATPKLDASIDHNNDSSRRYVPITELAVSAQEAQNTNQLTSLAKEKASNRDEAFITDAQSPKDTSQVLNRLNESLKSLQSYVQFERDQDTEKMVFFVKNSETDEIIRQIPSSELLEISKNITRYLESAMQSPATDQAKPAMPTGLLTNEVA